MSILYDIRNCMVSAAVGAVFGYALAKLPSGEEEGHGQEGANVQKLLVEIEELKAERKKLEGEVERLLEESQQKTAQLEAASIHSHLPAHESRTTTGKQEQTVTDSSGTESAELLKEKCQALQTQLESATAAAEEQRRQEDKCRLLEQELQSARVMVEEKSRQAEDVPVMKQQLAARMAENKRLEAESKQIAEKARNLQQQLEAKGDEPIRAATQAQVQSAPPVPQSAMEDLQKQVKEKDKFIERIAEENKHLDELAREHSDKLRQMELRFQTALQESTQHKDRCTAMEEELKTAKASAEEGKMLAAKVAELEEQLKARPQVVEEVTKAAVVPVQETVISAAKSEVQQAGVGMDDQTDSGAQQREKEQFTQKLTEENRDLAEQCRTYADKLKQIELQLATATEEGRHHKDAVTSLQQELASAKAASQELSQQLEVIKELQVAAEESRQQAGMVAALQSKVSPTAEKQEAELIKVSEATVQQAAPGAVTIPKEVEKQLAAAKVASEEVKEQAKVINELRDKVNAKDKELDGLKAFLSGVKEKSPADDAKKKKVPTATLR